MENRTRSKIILVLVVVLMTLQSCVLLSSCQSADDRLTFTTEDFVCRYNQFKTGIIIVKLTETGAKREILYIPEEINGLPVVSLLRVTNRYEMNNTVKSRLAKKVYIKNTKWLLRLFILFPNAEVVYLWNSEQSTAEKNELIDRQVGTMTTNFKKLIVDVPIQEEVWQYHQSVRKKIYQANVYFYCEDELVWIDYISEQGLYLPPPTEQEENFDGWYTDKELTKCWNGEYVIPEGQENLILYAKTK